MIYKAGELYLIGEVDLQSSKDLPFYKIGLVRDKENRSTEDRLREHQTGNPRLLKTHWVIRTPAVEQIETTLHGRFAPWRVSGEWFHLDGDQLDLVHNTTKGLATQAEKNEEYLIAAEQLKDMPSIDSLLRPTEDAISLHRKLGILKANLNTTKDLVKKLKKFFDSLHKAGDDVSDYFSQTDRAGTIEFDEESFKTKHPQLWEQYLVTKMRPEARFILTELSAFKKDESLLKPELGALLQELDRALASPRSSKAFARQMHGYFLEVLSIQSPFEWEEALAEAELKALCGEAAGIDGLCTWNRKLKESTSFDKTTFKNDHPETWDLYASRKRDTVSTALRRDRNYRIG